MTTTSSPQASGSRPRGSPTWQLSIAGLTAVGVSFGFARYGYGLFLPEIRAEFELSVSLVGLIASATYVGYMVALVLVGILAPRVGPRALIATGGVSAAVGMAVVGLAPGVEVLSAGLVLAGTSSGWIWAPYSDAVDRMLPVNLRERVLAVIPSGTAFGVVVSGPLALIARGSAWRSAWLLFALGAVAATVYNLRILPAGPARRTACAALPRVGVRWFARRAAIPLYLTALSYGIVGSVYWLLAVEAVSSASEKAATTPVLFWTMMGAAGVAGVFAPAAFARLGLRSAHVLLFTLLAVSVALLAVAPGVLAAVGASALLYGPAFMAVSAMLAVLSYRVFPQQPTTGFSAIVIFIGIGTVVGPATIGAVADRYDMRTAFLSTAAVAILALLARPREGGTA